MKLEKIYESLGIDKLDEEKQKEIKTYLDETIELKAKEIADKKLDEERDNLVEKYEQKFEDYKEDITEKFSNFVDDIMEKELQIPEKIKKFAKIGERYEPVISQLKIMLGIDEGSFDDQAKEIMSEAKEEILKLKDKVNKLIGEKTELKDDAEAMANHIYLRKKCDGLTEAKREKVMKLLEDVKGKDEIDRKFKIVSEEFNIKTLINEEKMYCSECDKEVEVEDDEDNSVCPDCGGDLTPSKKEKDEEKEEKEEKNESKKTNESYMDIWKSIIKENRF